MTQPLQQLTEDHCRIRRTLSCFEAQLDRFERAERPDYEILEGSIAYCQEYLDRWHHPRGSALLELLQRRAPLEARVYADLKNQHLRLAYTTGEAVKVFEAVECDAEYSRAHLVEMGRMLVDDHRQHLEWEEANFLPALRSHLLPEDWREIARLFADTADSLTRNPVDRRFRILFSTLDEP